jgi:uncharacterized membrane protein YeaQ/YmgE (transglycosylase-associated protein family)
MLWELLSLALVGAAVGALGRVAAPGPRPSSWFFPPTAGLVGALVGGLLTSVALGRAHRVTIFTVGIVFAAMLALGQSIFHRARALRAEALPPE